MSKGNAKLVNVGETGQVISDNASNWSFIYETSLVKDSKYNIGDRVNLPDGREFRYAKSGSALNGGFGAAFWRPLTFNGGTFGAAAIGDASVQITLDAGVITAFGSDITKDGLRGGYFLQADTGTPAFRGIIGNSAGGDTDVITIYLDGPLTRALVTTSFCEILANPYGDLRGTGGSGAGESGTDYISFAGVPATTVAAALTFFWVQTHGISWITPNQPVADAAFRRDVFFRNDGAIISGGDITVENGYQRAGYVIDKTGSSTDNPPFIMLEVS